MIRRPPGLQIFAIKLMASMLPSFPTFHLQIGTQLGPTATHSLGPLWVVLLAGSCHFMFLNTVTADGWQSKNARA